MTAIWRGMAGAVFVCAFGALAQAQTSDSEPRHHHHSSDGKSDTEKSTADASSTAHKSSPGTPAQPAVLGFGVGDAPKATLSANTKSPDTHATSNATSSTNSTSNSSSGSSAEMEKYRNYAKSLLKRYDTNQNGILEKDEWSKMSGDMQKADLNGDGVITLEELTSHLAGYTSRHDGGSSSAGSSNSLGSNSVGNGSASKTATSTSASQANPAASRMAFGSPPSTSTPSHGDSAHGDSARSDSSRSKSSSGQARSSSDSSSASKSSSTSSNASGSKKHFLTAAERLPEGLPDWFIRADVNGDGQVTMAEYASTWTESKAAEFAKYDLNGDGIITAQECLQVEKANKHK